MSDIYAPPLFFFHCPLSSKKKKYRKKTPHHQLDSPTHLIPKEDIDADDASITVTRVAGGDAEMSIFAVTRLGGQGLAGTISVTADAKYASSFVSLPVYIQPASALFIVETDSSGIDIANSTAAQFGSGFSVSPGRPRYFRVSLTEPPLGDVLLQLEARGSAISSSSSSSSESVVGVSISPSRISFPAQFYNSPQLIAVSHVSGPSVSTVAVLATGGGYDGIKAATSVTSEPDPILMLTPSRASLLTTASTATSGTAHHESFVFRVAVDPESILPLSPLVFAPVWKGQSSVLISPPSVAVAYDGTESARGTLYAEFTATLLSSSTDPAAAVSTIAPSEKLTVGVSGDSGFADVTRGTELTVMTGRPSLVVRQLNNLVVGGTSTFRVFLAAVPINHGDVRVSLSHTASSSSLISSSLSSANATLRMRLSTDTLIFQDGINAALTFEASALSGTTGMEFSIALTAAGASGAYDGVSTVFNVTVQDLPTLCPVDYCGNDAKCSGAICECPLTYAEVLASTTTDANTEVVNVSSTSSIPAAVTLDTVGDTSLVGALATGVSCTTAELRRNVVNR